MTSTYRRLASRIAFMAAFSGLVGAAPAWAKPVSLVAALGAIDRNFTCPEFLPDDAARQADLTAFGQALAAVGPRRLTLADATNIRVKMLVRHHCYDTLAAIGQPTAVAVQPASQSAVTAGN